MLDIHFKLIAMTVRNGKTLQEREAANQLRWWCIKEWNKGLLNIHPHTLAVLIDA